MHSLSSMCERRPTLPPGQLSLLSLQGQRISSNPCNTLITGVETIKRQTWAAYGCLVIGQKAKPMAYRLYARCRWHNSAAAAAVVTCGAIYVLCLLPLPLPLPLSASWRRHNSTYGSQIFPRHRIHTDVSVHFSTLLSVKETGKN